MFVWFLATTLIGAAVFMRRKGQEFKIVTQEAKVDALRARDRQILTENLTSQW